MARAPALHAGGQRFESVILHFNEHRAQSIFDILYNNSTSKFRISKVNTLEHRKMFKVRIKYKL